VPRETIALFAIGTVYSGKEAWANGLPEKFPRLRIRITDAEQEDLWNQEAMAATGNCDVLLSTAGRHLDPRRLASSARHLYGLGITDLSIQYFPARPLWDLIALDAAELKRQIMALQPEERYWEALEREWAAVRQRGGMTRKVAAGSGPGAFRQKSSFPPNPAAIPE
jgi:hypothetical protein